MKKLHIAVIILGTLFILLGAFHTNLWFDEAYTVGIVGHNFAEIWEITGNDVHPPLYYWMLRIVSFFTTSIIAYRLFSVVAIVLLATLGYTHIKKDFGDKVRIYLFISCFILTIYDNLCARNKNVLVGNAICNTYSNICL
ncbi:MAG: hypothetical protein FWC68_04385 [Oscillospiraceae bacterium]|nr:hypothetical protein [Oscillospiraceae bacterium]